MRVLHVLHTSLPHICGYSIRSNYIVQFQKTQGLDPRVVTSAQQPPPLQHREDLQGVTCWRTPAMKGTQTPLIREWRLMRALNRRIQDAIREWRPDLIHAHSPVLVGLPALLAARKHGLPLVYEVRDLWENASVDMGKFAADSPLYRLARQSDSWVMRRADAVVTIGERLKETIATRIGRTDRLFVVGNGVDTSKFEPHTRGESVRNRLGLHGKHIIGYIGTFLPYEGLDLLLSAMPQIKKQVAGAHLVITGSGGQEKHLRALAASLSLEDCVTFTGRIPHGEVKEMYELADVMVYPRVLTRVTAVTTPLKPLEAMAMGKAIVASDVPAMQELVKTGKTGLTFRAGNVSDLADVCSRLLQQPGQQMELGRQARQWVQHERQWDTLVARYQNIYAIATRPN